ncbi:HigA family addiction module antitoxin [Paucilactobacillus hokkaidonensis]|uniref:HigA family addiction module antitoxin n=1 Tax=Paucilactobacillus hokkaidonensis TaxID=1193095 RepID=UPI0006D13612|nr:HigA family addiction module antitoxin [Paucilactobacillus hokkaidonensis]
MNEEHNENLIAFHPGYYVKEYLNYQGMKQSELAERLNISEKTVSYLVNGQMNVDNDMADKLALVLGTSPILWKNLNNKYLETKDKIDKEKQLEEEKLILQQMDYAFWSRNGLVKQTSKLSEKVDELKKFLRISSLEVLEKSDFFSSIQDLYW